MDLYRKRASKKDKNGGVQNAAPYKSILSAEYLSTELKFGGNSMTSSNRMEVETDEVQVTESGIMECDQIRNSRQGSAQTFVEDRGKASSGRPKGINKMRGEDVQKREDEKLSSC